MTLPVRPSRKSDESDDGYMLRLADANGVLTGYSWDSFLRATAESGAAHQGSPLSSPAASNDDAQYVLRGFLRVCPLCLAEGPYWRASWDHAFSVSCLRHKVQLIDRCSDCGKVLGRGIGRLVGCSCGSLYAESAPVPVEPSYLEYALSQRLGLDKPSLEGDKLACIRSLSSDALIKLIVVLGSYSPTGNVRKPRKVPLKRGATNARAIINRASVVLADWPNNFRQLLDDSYRRHPRNSTLKAVFGSLYGALYKDLQGAQFDFVRTAFDSWVADKWSGYLTERHQRISRATRSKKRVVPVTRLSRDLGISPKRLEDLVLAGMLRGSVRPLPSGKKSTMIELDQVSQARKLTNLFNLEVASKTLGLPEVRLRSLLEAGIVAGRRPKPGGKWRIHVGELDRLFELMKALPIHKETDHETFLSLDKVLRFYWTEADSFPELFGAIVRGELACVRRPHIKRLGAAVILIPRETFMRWQLARAPGISVQALAERLQVKQEVAYHLVRRRLIQVTNRGRLGDFVAEEEIARFQEQYIWARELAQAAHTSPKKMVSVLRSTGIQAVAGPGVDSCRQYLYRRRDVAQAAVF